MIPTLQISQYVLSALAVFIILAIHEFSHAWVANLLGDPTAKAMGRLTLNPIKHLDPIGAICMVVFHFGWAKPVPIDLRYFKKPKRDFAITALAGPLSNLICALFGALGYLILYACVKDVAFASQFSYNLAYFGLYFLLVFHQINLGFAIFNLLPVPPLDGSRLLFACLPEKAYNAMLRYERVIYYGILIWLLLGSVLSNLILSIPSAATSPFLTFVADVLSLSGLIERAILLVSRGMMGLWQLIPALKF